MKGFLLQIGYLWAEGQRNGRGTAVVFNSPLLLMWDY